VNSLRYEFINAVLTHQPSFDLALSEQVILLLADYYEFVQEHNPLLHLVAPCSAEAFATRHILESLTLLEHLPRGAKFADVGAGAGLPSIPCLLARDDLRSTLIESKEKKAAFLNEALTTLGISGRGSVINRQFSEAEPGDATFVTCRALDKLTAKLPRLLKWSGERSILLFGGENLREALTAERVSFVQNLLPLSERRFLFVIDGKTK
jgi:16S rRNA (guanine527-N7)-methyltransferase